jgi:hypothetical protein
MCVKRVIHCNYCLCPEKDRRGERPVPPNEGTTAVTGWRRKEMASKTILQAIYR